MATPSSLTPFTGASFATRTLTQGAELAQHDIGDRLREALEQLMRMIGGECLQALDDRRIIERVGEIAGAEDFFGRQPELDVETHRLRQLPLPVVDADARLDAKVVNEDRVHAAYNPRGAF